ncbi:hypothetical protein NL676_016030 [Syzygium grande]|nr:hypothetical protein NL676_016030 [Syzygium grande]
MPGQLDDLTYVFQIQVDSLASILMSFVWQESKVCRRAEGNVHAIEWALRHVARRGHTVLVLGLLCENGKRASCFSFHMGEKLERLGEGEVDPTELEEEIARKRDEFKSCLQPFYRPCKKNEVQLESKIAAGLCPRKVTVDEAQSCNTCWIILDSHLKKNKTYIYAHVCCNLAIVKCKDVVTLMPSKVILQKSSLKHRRVDDALLSNEPITDDQEEKSITPPPKTCCCHVIYPLGGSAMVIFMLMTSKEAAFWQT